MIERGIPYYTVDAFTDSPFGGNPAAVCLDADKVSDEGRLRIAQEMNLSETAFVHRPDSDGVRRLRWFTPVAEVPLCGHATLASAHVLLREMGAKGPVVFDSASGPLIVHEDDGRLLMDLPAAPATEAPMPPGLMEALDPSAALGDHDPADNRPAFAGPHAQPSPTRPRADDPADRPVFAASAKVALVALPSEDAVLSVQPDFGAMARLVLPGAPMGVAVTAPGAAPDVDFVSRFFAPWLGVDEDPVTGVAHTTLTPWWAGRLGKTEMSARQRSRRGGSLLVRSKGDRVELLGQAVTVAAGAMVRPA